MSKQMIIDAVADYEARMKDADAESRRLKDQNAPELACPIAWMRGQYLELAQSIFKCNRIMSLVALNSETWTKTYCDRELRDTRVALEETFTAFHVESSQVARARLRAQAEVQEQFIGLMLDVIGEEHAN